MSKKDDLAQELLVGHMHAERIFTNHLFLCPRNALGRPVKISTVPRTPKAGSILVASSVAAASAQIEVGVGVGAIVRVTLTTVGNTLTIARVWVPVVLTEVEVKDVVSLITVTLAETAAGELDCAEEESMREARKRRGTRASQGIRRGDMEMMVEGRRRKAHETRWKRNGAC